MEEENKRKEENVVSSGISLFKILLIIVIAIVLGLLVYLYKSDAKRMENISNPSTSASSTENFYYQGLPEEVRNN